VDDHNDYFNIQPYTWPEWFLYHSLRWATRPILMRSVGRVLAILLSCAYELVLQFLRLENLCAHFLLVVRKT